MAEWTWKVFPIEDHMDETWIPGPPKAPVVVFLGEMRPHNRRGDEYALNAKMLREQGQIKLVVELTDGYSRSWLQYDGDWYGESTHTWNTLLKEPGFYMALLDAIRDLGVRRKEA
tara:strand:+ start:1573 stop:1917 length:345 start_codon:yes stop_codon:yes gene_type:complete